MSSIVFESFGISGLSAGVQGWTVPYLRLHVIRVSLMEALVL